MAGRCLTLTLRRDLQDGGPHHLTEAVDVLGVPASRKVALFDETSLRCLRTAWSDPDTGLVNFAYLAADRPFLLVALDHADLWASPTVRRIATLTGDRP